MVLSSPLLFSSLLRLLAFYLPAEASPQFSLLQKTVFPAA